MRRKDLEITDQAEVVRVLRRALVCRLGLSNDDLPYVVPLTFGYEEGVLYFHSAPRGRKIDMIKANGAVCFEVDVDHEVVTSGGSCKWGMRYNSVVGFGTASLVEDAAGKRKALEAIRAHYSAGGEPLPDAKLDSVAVIRVDIESMTGRTTCR